MTTNSEKPILISFKLCPYVQRSVIALLEKNVPYDLEYIDLYNKPEWFLKISPFGKVPVLKIKNQVLFESAVINEYLDETIPPQMHPKDPLVKAHNRAWIEFISACLVDMYKLWVAENESTAQESINTLKHKFSILEEQINNQPYFNGQNFSLIDAAAAPLLQRLSWCEDIKQLGLFDHFPKIQKWKSALLNRKSVQNSTVPNIKNLFNEYAKGHRSESHNTKPSWLANFL